MSERNKNRKEKIPIKENINPCKEIIQIVSKVIQYKLLFIKQNENKHLINSQKYIENLENNNNIQFKKFEEHIEIGENYDENGHKNGFFIQKWVDGKECFVNFIKDKINGWAKLNNLEIKILGEFNNNFLNGYGEVFFTEENRIQKGYWVNGVIGGVGYEKTSNYIYSGSFINGKKNGYGTQIWRDKAKYEGEWKDNQFSGYGIYYFPDGKKYIGEWENSCKNGFGELSLINGRKYVGFYKNDKKEGFGISYLNDNSFTINFWKNGKKHGLEKYIIGNKVI